MKNTTKNMKRQVIEWKQIFADHISDRKLVYRIYEELSKLKKKKETDFFFLMSKTLNRLFTKEDMCAMLSRSVMSDSLRSHGL